ncbi:unnamed protein product [Pseudomonas synxantha]|nr:unnamed protein product [Pseudomonas synxantha]
MGQVGQRLESDSRLNVLPPCCTCVIPVLHPYCAMALKLACCQETQPVKSTHLR